MKIEPLEPGKRMTLEAIRKSCGFSLNDVARITKINKGALSQYESGKVEPTFSKAIALALAYGISLETLAKAMGYLKNSDRVSPEESPADRE